MHLQLRVYEIESGRLQDFVEEWRDLIVPLRRKLGFEVTEAWASEEDDTFTWLLAYDGEHFTTADAAYYASPVRKALQPDPARLIKRIVVARLVRRIDLG